jgi:hypothetical protein
VSNDCVRNHILSGLDGFLVLRIPVGIPNSEVKVKVELDPILPPAQRPFDREKWKRFVSETAGAWQGEFERPDQGEFEIRDSFE